MKNNNSTWKAWLFMAVFLSIIFGLIKGCTNSLMGGDFIDGFLEETNWIMILLVFLLFIGIAVIIGGFFGGKKDPNV